MSLSGDWLSIQFRTAATRVITGAKSLTIRYREPLMPITLPPGCVRNGRTASVARPESIWFRTKSCVTGSPESGRDRSAIGRGRHRRDHLDRHDLLPSRRAGFHQGKLLGPQGALQHRKQHLLGHRVGGADRHALADELLIIVDDVQVEPLGDQVHQGLEFHLGGQVHGDGRRGRGRCRRGPSRNRSGCRAWPVRVQDPFPAEFADPFPAEFAGHRPPEPSAPPVPRRGSVPQLVCLFWRASSSLHHAKDQYRGRRESAVSITVSSHCRNLPVSASTQTEWQVDDPVNSSCVSDGSRAASCLAA